MSVCLMFHSIGLRRMQWTSPQIAEDIGPFRGKLEAIRRLGYEVVPFSDPRLAHPKDARKLVCITFDDGYLDNWVHALPLLEEYEMPATIFVSTDFIDPRDVLRRQRGDHGISDGQHDPVGCCAGFLSWSEMRALEAGGLVEIESHAATHSRWPCSGEIVEYWRPGSATRTGGPIHELWNLRPEEKPFYLTNATEHESRIEYGFPVLTYERALVARRYFADAAELRDILTRFVSKEGGADFFTDADVAHRRLNDVSNAWIAQRGGHIPGRLETDEERDARIFEELDRSRRVLSEGLNKEISSICWPEGSVDARVLELAREAGYTRYTLPSSWSAQHAAGAYQDLVPRISSAPRIHRAGVDLGNPTSLEFEWYLRSHAGSRPHQILLRAAKAARFARARLAPFG